MTTEAGCRAAAARLVGQTIASVTYVGLNYYGPPEEVRWEFIGWDWPEVGVELTTASGDSFCAIWDSEITHFELTFAAGPLGERWLPLRTEPSSARAWDVTHHPRWSRVVGATVTDFALAFWEPDDPPVTAPVAIRLGTARGCAWLVAAGPRDHARDLEELTAQDVYLGQDEMIVLFDDERARRLGLIAVP